MKRLILLFIILSTASIASAKRGDNVILSANVGTAIDFSQPSCTPFNWQIIGLYKISDRFYAGIGTGVHIYEKGLLPLFADAKFLIAKPKKFTPYVECALGHSFAPEKKANGGFYFNPSIGIQYPILKDKKISFAIGYELQELERIKSSENELFKAEFLEKLSHNSISMKIGIIF